MTPQTLPMPDASSMHWMTDLGIILAMALSKVWDARFAHPRIKKERNEELDSRLISLRTALDIGHQSIRDDLQGVVSRVQDLSAHVIGPDGQNGLRGEVREMKADVRGLLEREPPRRRKR